ncbi:MAG: hypothetical protein WCK18_19010 [Prolixibacteraceae bacterium]
MSLLTSATRMKILEGPAMVIYLFQMQTVAFKKRKGVSPFLLVSKEVPPNTALFSVNPSYPED